MGKAAHLGDSPTSRCRHSLCHGWQHNHSNLKETPQWKIWWSPSWRHPQINELFHVQCKFAREWDCGRKRPCLDGFGEEMERVACLRNAADGKPIQYNLPHIPLFLAATQILRDQVLCDQVVVTSCYWRPERRWSNRWMWSQHIKILRVRIEMKWESDVSVTDSTGLADLPLLPCNARVTWWSIPPGQPVWWVPRYALDHHLGAEIVQGGMFRTSRKLRSRLQASCTQLT